MNHITLQYSKFFLKFTVLNQIIINYSRIHTFGNKFCAEKHPDSRAIFYEAKTYSKRKIFDLLNTLHCFEKVQELPSVFQNRQCRLLKKLTQYKPTGIFPDLSETIKFFKVRRN